MNLNKEKSPLRYITVGTAGHIDHGKTRLVQALTGTNTDRLKEEQKRGITIDLGFANTTIGPFQIGFVDVPGHERFVKNMLAGIAGIQFLLLVVAADESIMPQTREHFEICRLLGIENGIVVLTKRDLVDSELINLVTQEIQEFVKGTFMENAPIVAIDSHTGRGIKNLRSILQKKLISNIPTPDSVFKHVFRLPIDRVFSLTGFGTIVTGTTCNGIVRKKEKIQAYPYKLESRIRNLQIYGKEANEATVGQRTALNLTGIEKTQLRRGLVLGPPKVFRPSYILDVSMELISSAPTALQTRTPVRVHHGSNEIIGRIYPIGSRRISPGETGLTQIRLEEPITACAGDRFIIRRYSPLMTIGGGIILNSRARKRKTSKLAKECSELQKLQKNWIDGHRDRLMNSILYYVKEENFRGISLRELQSRTGLTKKVLYKILQGSQDLIFCEAADLFVSIDAFSELQNQIIDKTRTFHSKHPLSKGIPKEELKEQLMSWASNNYFNAILQDLQETHRIRSSAHTVADFKHNILLTPSQEKLRKQILKILDTHHHKALKIEELAGILQKNVDDLNDVFFFLIQRGDISRISENLFMGTNKIEQWTKLLIKTYPSGNSFSVSDFKNLFLITRKLAIPFLEYLDKNKVTRRVSDHRIVL